MAKTEESGRTLEQVLATSDQSLAAARAASERVVRLTEHAADVMYQARRLQRLSRVAIEEAQRWLPLVAKESRDPARPVPSPPE